MKLTDMHSHILPGVDDGARDIEETLDVLRMAKEQRVSRIILTPHFHPGRYQVSADEVLAKMKEIQAACDKEGIDIKLYPGHECYYYSGLVEDLESGKALTLAGSHYVLVEFDTDSRLSTIISGLFSIREAGYEPILAHFERYETLEDEDHLETLKEHGYLLQMNFDMLVFKDRFFKKNPWRILVQEGYADFLGSDCHGMNFRPLQIDKAMKWIGSNLDVRLKDRILENNIDCILKDKIIG